MNHRHRPLMRAIALVLANALFWQPVVVLAGGIQIAPNSGNTRLDQAGNGVPVVRIATPTAEGLSHNTFNEYNVEKQGIILNNGRSRIVDTQLGGKIIGNSNLSERAAQTILNEVVGGDISRLEGYTEVAGQAANVILSNSHGIVCDGCGYLNVPHATLSTGRPVIEDGKLDHYAVDQGRVSIEGLGLDASQVDRVDIITRAAEINAAIHSGDALNIVTGANDVKADSLTTTPREGTGKRPQVSIDAAALGGMYANTIMLVGTEDGVGVKVPDNMAAAGDLSIDSQGRLVARNLSSGGTLLMNVASADLKGDVHGHESVAVTTRHDLTIDGQLTSAGDISLEAGRTLRNRGQVVAGIENNQRRAGAELSVEAQRLVNSGDLNASRQLSITANRASNRGQWLADELDVQVARQLTNAGVVQGERVTVTTPRLTNQGEDATLAATKTLEIDSDRLVNRGLIQYAPGQDLQFDGERLDNRGGRLQLDGDITGELASLNNTDGHLTADSLDVDVRGDLSNSSGVISAEVGDLDLAVAGTLENARGTLQSQQGRFMLEAGVINSTRGTLLAAKDLDVTTSGRLSNTRGHLQSSNGRLSVTTAALFNQYGSIKSKQALEVSADGKLNNVQGSMTSDQGSVTLSAATIDSTRGSLRARRDLTLTASGALSNRHGEIESTHGNVTLDAGRLDNGSGRVLARRALAVTTDRAIVNRAGELLAGRRLGVTTDDTLNNQKQGRIQSTGGNVALDVGRLDNASGQVLAQHGLDVTSDHAVVNVAGELLARKGALTVAADRLDNSEGGAILAEQDVTLTTTGTLNNSLSGQGGIQSRTGNVTLEVGELTNTSGKVLAQQALDVTSDGAVVSRAGTLLAKQGTLSVTAERLDTSHGGELVADRAITLRTSGTLNNSRSGTGGIQSRHGDVTLDVGSLENTQGHLVAEQALTLTSAGDIGNANGVLDARQGNLTVTTEGDVTNDSGLMQAAQGNVALEAAGLSSRKGTLLAGQSLDVTVRGETDNTEGALQAMQGNVTVTTEGLINRGGELLADQGLTVTARDEVDNRRGGWLQATHGNLSVAATDLDNTNGTLVAGQDLSATVSGTLGNQEGIVDARGGDLTLDTGTLLNEHGNLVAAQSLNVTVQGETRNVHGALEARNGDLSLETGGLISTDGTLRAGQSIEVAARKAFQNRRGVVHARNGDLTLRAASLDSRGGTLGAGQDMNLAIAGTLDNRADGLIVGQQVGIEADTLRNARSGPDSSGTLSGESVALTLARLVNDQGRISADQDLNLDVTHQISNVNGRLQAIDGDLTVSSARSIDNTEGVMVGRRLEINASGQDGAVGTLVNHDGQLVGNALVLNATRLDNTGRGLVTAEQGNATLSLTERLINRGTLQASGTVRVTTPTLDNRRGALIGQGFDLHVSRLLNQHGALLGEAGGGAITLTANADGDSGALHNAEGVIDVKDGALTVQAAGAALDNRSGSLSADRLTITADSLDNSRINDTTRGGQLVAEGHGQGPDLTLDVRDTLRNDHGVIAAQGGFLAADFSTLFNRHGSVQGDRLRLTGKTLINTDDGRITALGGDATLVLTDTLDNRRGHIVANGTLDIDPPLLDNRDGELAGRAIALSAGHLDNRRGMIESEGPLSIDVNRLSNQGGDLRSLGGNTSEITVTGTLDNANGEIALGSRDATLTATTLNNAQGRIRHAGHGLLAFVSNTLNNRAGQIQGEGDARAELDTLGDIGQWGVNGRLTLDLATALSLDDNDRLTTPGALTLLLPGLDNAGEIRSNDGLRLQVRNDIVNRGVIATLGDLNIAAHDLTQRGGRLATGGAATYALDGTLDNEGFLTSVGDMSLKAAGITNRGTLGSQTHLRLVSPGGIENRKDSLLFAGGDMTLRTSRLVNRHADVTTRGNLSVARNDALAFADRVENRSGTIEAEGDIALHADQVLNTSGAARGKPERVSRTLHGTRYDWMEGTYEAGVDGAGTWPLSTGDMEVVLREEYVTKADDSQPKASLVADGDLTVRASRFENVDSLVAANHDVDIVADTVVNRATVGGRTVKETRYRKGDVQQYHDLADTYLSDDRCSQEGGSRRCRVSDDGIYYEDVIVEDLDDAFAAWNAAGGMDAQGNDLPLPALLQGADAIPLPAVFTPDKGVTRGSAVITAGDTVSITARERIQNGEIRDGVLTQLKGELGETTLEDPLPAAASITLGRRTGPAETADITAATRADRRDAASADRSTATVASRSATGATGANGVSARETGMTDVPVDGVAIDTDHPSTRPHPDTHRTGSGASPTPGTSREVPFQRVAPTEAGGFRLPEGQYGLFVPSPSPKGRYRVETNPALTDRGRWLGSGYLLGKLGYTPDDAQRQLGDGRFEARLIRDAVMSATGRRFLDPALKDDREQFRYLMDNAIRAQQALNLRVGVRLTEAQMAALTHDIVWPEEQVIDGQKVLVPVLYLAKLDDRNVRGGSVIQGRDLNLIAGKDLVNVGTLRADDDITARSGGSVLQGGLVEAGGDVDLEARDDVRNGLSGEIRGENVRIAAREGDAVNDRLGATVGNARSRRSYVDEGGVIEARRDLDIRAGRDVVNRAELRSGDDTRVAAGRDVRVAGVTEEEGEGNARTQSRRTRQDGASVEAGGDLTLDAGRDVEVTASEVAAGGDLGVAAGRDIGVASAADETSTRPERSETAVGSSVTAGKDLTLDAGRDVEVTGSEVDAGGDLGVAAGRDIRMTPAVNAQRLGAGGRETVAPVGATLSGGEDVTLQAGRDVTAVAATLEAGDDVAIDAGRDLTLAPAAHRTHEETHTRGGPQVEQTVRQQGTEVRAGDDVALKAGDDLTLTASTVEAGDDAYLYARDEIALEAAHDQDYALEASAADGGLFRGSRSRRDEVSDTRAVGSGVTTGGNLAIVSGGDQTYEGAELDVGDDLTMRSGGEITFEMARDLHSESHEKSHSNFAWQSSEGEGETTETLRQARITVGGQRLIKAAEGIAIEVEDVNQQTVHQTIDAMVEADPALAWLKDMEARGDIDWREVKAIRDRWDYDHEGVGQGLAMVVAIVAAAFGQVYVGQALAATSIGGTAAATGISAAAGAVAAATAVGTINEPDNPLAGLEASVDEDTIKSAFTAALTAGIAQGLFPDTFDPATLSLTNPDQLGQFARQQAALATVNAGVETAINGGSFADNLKTSLEDALLNVASGKLFDAVGDLGYDPSSAENVALHALAGGVLAEAMGGDFKTGALAAGASEALVKKLDALVKGNPTLLVALSEATGVTAAAMVGGDEADGQYIAGQGTRYNYLSHTQKAQKARELEECESVGCEIKARARWALISAGQNQALATGFVAGAPASVIDALADLTALFDGDTYAAIAALMKQDNVLATLGEAVADDYRQRFADMQQAYQRAGADGAFHAGLEAGKLFTEVASLLGGAGELKAALTTTRLARRAGQAAEDVATTGRPIAQALPEGATELHPVGAKPHVPDGYRVFQTADGDRLYQSPTGEVYADRADIPQGAEAANLPKEGTAGPNTGASYHSLTRPTDESPANTILGSLDELGRPTGVTATIKPGSLKGGTVARSSIRPPGFDGEGANHARGHLLARMLGGAGDDSRNLVTLFQRNANHPNMSGFERQVRAAVQAGETVSFRAVPMYTGDNLVPAGVTLTARGSRGLELDVSIPNISGVP